MTTDMSLWTLFIEASLVVQLVMLLLLVASLISWYFIFQKGMLLKSATMSMLGVINPAATLTGVGRSVCPGSR